MKMVAVEDSKGKRHMFLNPRMLVYVTSDHESILERRLPNQPSPDETQVTIHRVPDDFVIANPQTDRLRRARGVPKPEEE
jgi:hypothetical protein